jgi:hypothetical protein
MSYLEYLFLVLRLYSVSQKKWTFQIQISYDVL